LDDTKRTVCESKVTNQVGQDCWYMYCPLHLVLDKLFTL